MRLNRNLTGTDAAALALGGSLGSLQPLFLNVVGAGDYRADAAMVTGVTTLAIGILTGTGVVPAPRGVTLFALGVAAPTLAWVAVNHFIANVVDPTYTSAMYLHR